MSTEADVSRALQNLARLFPDLGKYGFRVAVSKGRCANVQLVQVDAAGSPVDADGAKIVGADPVLFYGAAAV